RHTRSKRDWSSDVCSSDLLIERAKNPVILAGRGAYDARAELLDFAEKIKAPIVLSLLGKGTIPDYHPLNLGQHGQIGTKPAFERSEERRVGEERRVRWEAG